MKKLAIILSMAVVVGFGFSGCEDDESEGDGCKYCKIVTYHPDGTVTYGTPEEFCNDDLSDIEAEEPVVDPETGKRTVWECE